jgi:ATP-dependent phosphofructokinase / diphosphate-dependent phosphofructokinase
VAPAVVVHSGGPTAVLNASLAGVVDSYGDRLYGARFGVEGLLSGNLIDLAGVQVPAKQAGSVLGSSRRRLTDSDYDVLIAQLRRRDIHTIFFTGGNGSMAAALAISRSCGYELQVIGIPKTIDNDLLVTHHSPGHASTAHFFACAARAAGLDNQSLPSPICVLETLGRNVGWIVAATSFARADPDDAPHLIYFPERPLSLDRIASDVEAVYRRLGRVVVAVCEGQLDETGQPFGADLDRELASNLGHTLARRISAKLGLRARAERPGLTGRSCRSCERDRNESYACGRAAVLAARNGEAEVMVCLNEDSTTFLTPLESVAGLERLMPIEWISESGNDVTPEYQRYAHFLAGGGG